MSLPLQLLEAVTFPGRWVLPLASKPPVWHLPISSSWPVVICEESTDYIGPTVMNQDCLCTTQSLIAPAEPMCMCGSILAGSEIWSGGASGSQRALCLLLNTWPIFHL